MSTILDISLIASYAINMYCSRMLSQHEYAECMVAQLVKLYDYSESLRQINYPGHIIVWWHKLFHLLFGTITSVEKKQNSTHVMSQLGPSSAACHTIIQATAVTNIFYLSFCMWRCSNAGMLRPAKTSCMNYPASARLSWPFQFSGAQTNLKRLKRKNRALCPWWLT